MLETGMEILRETPAGQVLSQVKATVVTERAGKTTGAFYNLWPNQPSYHRELIRYAMSQDRFRTDTETRGKIADYLSEPEFDLAELFRVVGNLNFDGLKTEPVFALQLALWAKHDTDADISAALRDLYRNLNETLIPLYEAILKSARRRLRPPYTVRSLAATLTALVEGLQIRWAVDPEAVPDDIGVPPNADSHEGRWGLFAAIAYTLILAMTEPITTG
jgi:AcrR family transcriptional regulator